MDKRFLNGWINEEATVPTSPARFFVTTGGHGGWLIYREGTMNPVESYRRKAEAIECAKSLARQEAPGEVLVEQRDGSFKPCFACESASLVA